MKPFNPKPRACSMCGNFFAPARPLQAVCGPKCALKKARTDTAQGKRELRAKKEALKTIPQLVKEAQVEFNRFVRMRDAHMPCISCGAPPPDMSQLHAGRDAGHYRSVGSAAHLRFHEDNCHAQCVRCNQWGAGRAVDYRIGLIKRIGVERVEALETNNEIRKWDRNELRALKETYRAKRRELEKQQ